MSPATSYLTVKKNGSDIKQVPLGRTMKIGRHRNADLQLEDPQLSREHAEITCEGERVFIRDLGSLNGTVLAGARLEPNKATEIQHGMTAEFASFLLEFTIVPVQPGPGKVAGLEDSKWSEAPPSAKPLLDDLIKVHGNIPVWTKGEVTLEVADIIEETPDVKTFRLVGKEPVLFSYKPGQFVTVKADIDGKKVLRSYSMSSSPSRPHTIEITVKRVPGGLVSNWMCDDLKLGSQMTVTGPTGKFSCFNYPSRKLLFIGAGSGVTPLMSMSRWIVDTSADVDIVMLVSARNPADIIFRKELELMTSRHSSFRLFFTMTRGWAGVDAWVGLSGHCSAPMMSLVAPDLHDRHVFVCGPNPFMDCVKDVLRALDFPLEKLHTESFGSGRVAQGAAPEAPAARPAKAAAAPQAVAPAPAAPPARAPVPGAGAAAPVSAPAPAPSPAPAPAVAKAGFLVEFVGKGKANAEEEVSLLDLAERQGIEIEYACRTGSCGSCKVLCKSGKVEHSCDAGELALDADDLGNGYVLACVAVPRSDCAIVVEA